MASDQINFRPGKLGRTYIQEIMDFYHCNQSAAIQHALAAKAYDVRQLVEQGETIESVTARALDIMRHERERA